MHDETTTKLELPTSKQSNVVRVQFGAGANESRAHAPILSNERDRKRSSLIPSWDELNLNSPWVIRLVAVLAILGLSLLMI